MNTNKIRAAIRSVLIYMEVPNTTLIVGPSGCGKTYKLLEIVTSEYMHYYDYIIILCPTIWINKTYLDWKYLESDKDVIGLDCGYERVDDVLRFIVKTYSGTKTAIIIDDMSNSKEQHINTNMITYLAYSGRHHNFSLFIISQKLNSISTGVRDNATRVLFFKTHNKRSKKVLDEEFFGRTEDEGELFRALSKGKYIDIKLDGNNGSYEVK